MKKSDLSPPSPLAGVGANCTSAKTIFNSPLQKQFRRELRKNLTRPEQILWAKIRNQQLGVKFRRQHGIGLYVADFYCAECLLVIELDGDSHYINSAQESDRIRDDFMQALQLRILRFSNQDIMENIDGVLSTIIEIIRVERPHPNPPLGRGGG